MKAGKIILSTVKSYVGKASRTLSKNSPTILLVAGSVGVVAGVVLAVKAGKESDTKTQKEREDLEVVHGMKDKVTDETTTVENGDTGETAIQTYTKIDYMRDLTHAYGNLIFAYAKVYGPAALTTLFSLFLIFSSHRILNNRFKMAYAGLAAMTKAYDAYRQNVIDAEGLEADQRYRFGIKAVEEDKPLFDKDGNPKLDKNGNPKSVKDRYDILTDPCTDPRSVLWDETTSNKFDFSTNDLERTDANNATIRNALIAANNKLKIRAKNPLYNGIGYITLNEVREMLGMKPVDVGFFVGWLYDPRFDVESDKFDVYAKVPDDWGDNRVDFGLDNPSLPGYEGRLRFMAGHEEAVMLYMNYDGIISDKLGLRTIYSKRR